MVGSSCIRALKHKGYNNLIFKNSSELDLCDQYSVREFIFKHKPDVIVNAAAKVGGIYANNEFKYEFIIDNTQIQSNLIRYAHEANVEKFIFLGSSCIYPKHANQPIKEEFLLEGQLEPTNQWYAIAKINGLKIIEALNKQYGRKYVSFMPIT